MKNEILIITIILIIATIFGCTSNAQSKSDSKVYGSDFVNFQMPAGWEVHPMPGDGTVIWMKGDPRIRVIELKHKEKFDSQLSKALNIDNGTYDIRKTKKIINGIEVNIIRTTHNGNGDIQDEYFFQKNNKYYNLEGWAFPGWNSQKTNTARKQTDKAIETIVNTIK
jgi:hypothetical protein